MASCASPQRQTQSHIPYTARAAYIKTGALHWCGCKRGSRLHASDCERAGLSCVFIMMYPKATEYYWDTEGATHVVRVFFDANNALAPSSRYHEARSSASRVMMGDIDLYDWMKMDSEVEVSDFTSVELRFRPPQ